MSVPETGLIGRPKFVWWIAYVQQLPLQIFLTIWASAFFGVGAVALTTAWTVLTQHRSNPGAIVTAILAGQLSVAVLFFLGIPAAVLFAKFMNYRNTRYMISGESLDIEEGFLTVRRKRILLNEIREVSLQRGVLQRLAGLGSVYVATYATGGGGRFSPSALLGGSSLTGSGAMLMDLEHWEPVYRRMMEATRAGSAARG